MSRENVEYVRRGYEAANRRDVDAWVEGFSAEFEFHTSGNFPDLEPVYRGREAFLTFAEQFLDPWEELSITPDRVIDAGVQVLALVHFHARGRDGIEVKLPLAHLWTLREGRAVRLDAYSDQEKALEAVGLSE